VAASRQTSVEDSFDLTNRNSGDGARLVKATLLPQTSDGVFYLQLAPLQLDQLEIIYRRMLAHLRQFRLQHPMPLFEFSKLERGHMANLLVSDRPA
jgi:hypothetical protein